VRETSSGFREQERRSESNDDVLERWAVGRSRSQLVVVIPRTADNNNDIQQPVVGRSATYVQTFAFPVPAVALVVGMQRRRRPSQRTHGARNIPNGGSFSY